MGWLLGCFSTGDIGVVRQRIQAVAGGVASFAISQETMLAVGGGTELTCHFHSQEHSGWIVCGLGIASENNGCRILQSQDWHRLMSQPEPPLHELNGHYLTLRWNAHELVAANDQLGLRSLYFSHHNNGIIFSTRLDYLCRVAGLSQIDFHNFGPHFLTFNQWRCGSLVEGVERLGQGGRGIFREGKLRLTEQLYLPKTELASSVENALGQFLQPCIPDGRQLALGLSGGFDSRLLLALLLQRKGPFTTYTFGQPTEPDVALAKQLAAAHGIACHHFDLPPDDPAHALPSLMEYAGQTMVVEPLSTWSRLRYYPQLPAERWVLVDGGYGEIGRRQFFGRFLKGGTDALATGDPDALLPFVRLHRAKLFNQETTEVMMRGVKEQLRSLWEAAPGVKEFGVGNLLDLWIVQARFPNVGGIEQSRVDSLAVNFMPFAQPDFLDAVFATPEPLRRNARLYRQMLHKAAPSLERFPLVKGVTTYPYPLGTIGAHLWVRAKKLIRPEPPHTLRRDFLAAMRPFILDRWESQQVRTYPHYDHAAIGNAIRRWSSGDPSAEGEVDWWLAFELWRGEIGSRK